MSVWHNPMGAIGAPHRRRFIADATARRAMHSAANMESELASRMTSTWVLGWKRLVDTRDRVGFEALLRLTLADLEYWDARTKALASVEVQPVMM